jgi:hypothetical protein
MILFMLMGFVVACLIRSNPALLNIPPGAVHLLSRNDLPPVICRDIQVYEKTGCYLFPGIG